MDATRQRKPFVDAIREEVADGFLISGVFGSAYHFAKGGFQAVCKNVPGSSCRTAVFFGVYRAIDYAMVSARQKKEPLLDGAVATAGAAGISTLHKGLRYASASALFGAALGVAVSGGLSLLQDRARKADDPVPDFSPNLLAEEIRS